MIHRHSSFITRHSSFIIRHSSFVIRHSLLTLLFLLATATASAALTSGYYRIKSYNDKYMTENTSNHVLVCSNALTTGSYSQVWHVDAAAGTLSNVLTGRYVQKTSGSSWSEQYTTGLNSSTFTINDEGDGIFTFTDKWSGGLHCDAALNVVLWLTDEAKSKWTIEEVDVKWDEVKAQQAALSEASVSDLTTFFTTTACTALRNDYASMTDEALRSAMSALPATVQDMAVKVKNNAWTTYDSWDKTEKTFRVADYKAYSSGDRWTGILGLGYHFGRLTNPTGITVSAGDILQVYVGDIPSGQTVRLEVAGEYQATGTTYTLKQGMNVLLMASDGNCFVQYEVDNTANGGAPYTAISNYADVTVHIEGGTVNGYFDLTKGDTNADWATLQSNLLTGTCVELKTGHLLFHMHTDLVKDACPTKMVELLGEWDKILDMEYSLMGLEEFDGYWNNLLSVTDMTGNSYMHATTYGTFYNVTTVPDVMSYENLFAGGALWGPAHENGHIFQKYINMVGQTEVSNNVFSNVAVYNNGHLTSRAANISTTLSNMANNVYWNERDIWERTHLYFQLYQFFHILGKDPDFYPNLFKALRSDPMVHTGNTFISATDDYLKFYKKCCEVSGYDLTEFFQAYGFFIVPTLTSYTLNNVTKDAFHVEDYSNYYLTVTQSEIDEATQAVADMNLPKCNIIFIEDRITAPLASYEGAAPGELKKAFSNEYPIGIGETGQYTDFGITPSAYAFNVSPRGNVTVSGTGAVGFKLYDATGRLVGVYNTTTFTLPAAAHDESDLKNGYTLQAAAGDGTAAVMTRDEGIEVNEFPQSGVWYTLSTPKRKSRYVTSGGSKAGIVSTETATPDATMQWKFVPRNEETETFDIVNNSDGSYINPSTASNGPQLSTSATQPSAGWTVTPVGTSGLHIISSGSVQLHIANEGNSYKVLNWGGGSNTADDGCLFAIEPVDDLSTTALAELDGLSMSVASTTADDVTTGQWYVMFDRGNISGYRHGYLYENTTSHTLYNTNTVPSGTATEAARYLVRLIEAPGDGCYYLQNGLGNYFWNFEPSTPVATTAYPTSRIKVAKIADADGHFYLQCVNNSVILDANTTYSGDATVVGYGTSIPTAIDGNNDWAFYPVTLSRTASMNAVGDNSYATFYYNKDMRTDDDTQAYYITSATDGYAQLTATPGDGHDIPACTAVVLINSKAADTATLTLTNGLDAIVRENDNLLKGTLSPIDLDLSDSSPNYSLGRLDGKIGFYKFKNGSSTTIILGANKAYLKTPASSGEVKGFTFGLDTATEVNERILPETHDSKCYDLSGRHVAKGRLHKGLYITGGRKVVVK